MPTFDQLGIDVRSHGSKSQKVKCPVCIDQRKNKSDKSLSVNLDTGAYNCHYCGWKGYAKDDAAQREEKKRQFARPEQIELPLSENAISWFQTRGIERETLQYFRISESKESMPPAKGADKWSIRNCINFNYYRSGEKVNIKFRDALKNFRMTKDAELILYNLDSLKERTDMLICEGEIDCMSFYQSGHYGAVSVPNGASKGSAKLEYLDNCADVFAGMEKIIIATDGDEAGTFLKNELTRRLGRHRCWFIDYPEGCKDANEVQLKYGLEGVAKLWKSAAAPPLEAVFTVDDLRDDLDDIYLNGWPAREPIGYAEFDELLNFAPGELTTVTGIPGHGKDEWITQVLIRKAARYGEKAAIFNYEEPAKIIQIKCAQKFIGRPFHRKDRNEMMNLAQRDRAYKFLNDHLFIIDNTTADLTIEGLISKATELVLRKGIKYFSIGPYNCIEHNRGDNQTEGEYISQVMQKLTRFASAYNVHIFFVVHPTKMRKENNKFIVPTLYDCAGSANFFNKTYNGLTVYRNYEDNTTDIYVQKVKFFFNGKLGYTTFKFDPHTGRYQEPGLDFESEVGHIIQEDVQLPIPLPEKPVEAKGFPTVDLSAWGQEVAETAPF